MSSSFFFWLFKIIFWEIYLFYTLSLTEGKGLNINFIRFERIRFKILSKKRTKYENKTLLLLKELSLLKKQVKY